MINYIETAYDDICDKILVRFGEIEQLKTVTFFDADTPQKEYEYPYIEFDLGDIKTNEKARNAKQIATITFEAIICAKSGPGKDRNITKLGLKIVAMLSNSLNGLEAYNINLMPHYFKNSEHSVQHQGEASRQLYFTIDVTIAEINLIDL